MPVTAICQACGAPLSIPDNLIGTGRPLACPTCKKVLTAAIGGTFTVDSPPRPEPAVPVPSPPSSRSVIRFRCPACKKVLKAPDRQAGQKIHCPFCTQRILIPPPVQVQNKTVLGEKLPDSGPASPDPASTPSPSATAAISTTCPGCGRVIPLEPHQLTWTIECARCNTRFIPAQPSPPVPPEAPPAGPLPQGAEPPPLPQPTEPPPEGAESATALVRFVRPLLAFVGACLLIGGQFCPMLTAPAGVSVNFFDYSTKTAWVLSKAAAKMLDLLDKASEEPPRAFPHSGQRDAPEEPPRVDPHPGRAGSDVADKPAKPPKPSTALRSAALAVGLVLTLLSPFSPIVLVGMAAWALVIVARGSTRSRDRRLVVAGLLGMLALGVLFLGPMLVLWAIPEELEVLPNIVLTVTSFGFGWGLLLIGCIALLVAGELRSSATAPEWEETKAGSGSIYAWLVGLPCGCALLAVALALLVPLGLVSYSHYQAHRARERAAKLKAEAEQRERLAREQAEAERRRHEQALERERQAAAARQEELRLKKEREEAKAKQAEEERKREEARIAEQDAHREREEQQLREKAERAYQAKLRIYNQQVAEIERDHHTIEEYINRNVYAGELFHATWTGPWRARAGEELGKLYRLDYSVKIRQVGDAKYRPEPRTCYCFLRNSDGGVAEHQVGVTSSEQRICQVLDDKPFVPKRPRR